MGNWDVYLGERFIGVWNGNIIGLSHIELDGVKYVIVTIYWTPIKKLAVN